MPNYSVFKLGKLADYVRSHKITLYIFASHLAYQALCHLEYR
ncbi:hypothetical protein [Sphaerospermopsis sp. FACHB-1194]|nr:hypothetical protein [Sphaerospermopsis sp. FACHB-1194]